MRAIRQDQGAAQRGRWSILVCRRSSTPSKTGKKGTHTEKVVFFFEILRASIKQEAIRWESESVREREEKKEAAASETEFFMSLRVPPIKKPKGR